MKARLAVFLAVAATAFTGGAVAPVSQSVALAPSSAYAHTCSGSYRHAVLPWGHKCLRAGQYCSLSGDRHYHRHGFHCHASSRDRNGRYHLTSR